VKRPIKQRQLFNIGVRFVVGKSEKNAEIKNLFLTIPNGENRGYL